MNRIITRMFRFDLVAKRISASWARPSLLVVTSQPYPALVVDGLNDVAAITNGYLLDGVFVTESLDDPTPAITAGSLRDQLQIYTNWQFEALNDATPTITAGILKEVLRVYTDWQFEAMNDATPAITAGVLHEVLIPYTAWQFEAMNDATPTITGGSLV